MACPLISFCRTLSNTAECVASSETSCKFCFKNSIMSPSEWFIWQWPFLRVMFLLYLGGGNPCRLTHKGPWQCISLLYYRMGRVWNLNHFSLKIIKTGFQPPCGKDFSESRRRQAGEHDIAFVHFQNRSLEVFKNFGGFLFLKEDLEEQNLYPHLICEPQKWPADIRYPQIFRALEITHSCLSSLAPSQTVNLLK